MFRTPLWFVCIWKRALPLIYWCMGLCNEYAKLWHTLRVIGYWWHHLQVAGVQFLLSSQDTRGLARRGAFSWHRYRSVSTDLLITCHHATPKLFCPSSLSLPFLFCLSIISLVLGFEQRAIWARLPASSGGPLHKKDSFSSTSVCQDQRHLCLHPYTPPPTTSPPLPLLFLPPKLPIH